MTQILHRRRLLQISAAAALTGLSSRAQADAPTTRWQGTALGAQAQIVIPGITPAQAAPIIDDIVAEIARLEHIFSLYDATSEISRLNQTGQLAAASADMRAVLATARSIYLASEGAFDPTVQPVWRALDTGQAAEMGVVGFDRLTQTASGGVSFARAGMALTLNGVAQGYITDQVANRLRAHGLRDVIVNAGEIAALGHKSGATPWQVGIRTPQGGVVQQVALSDRALATSSPMGTKLGTGGHVLDPRTGATARAWGTVSVSHPSAAIADALSTAACLLPRAQLDAMIAQTPEAQLVFAA